MYRALHFLVCLCLRPLNLPKNSLFNIDVFHSILLSTNAYFMHDVIGVVRVFRNKFDVALEFTQNILEYSNSWHKHPSHKQPSWNEQPLPSTPSYNLQYKIITTKSTHTSKSNLYVATEWEVAYSRDYCIWEYSDIGTSIFVNIFSLKIYSCLVQQ